MTCSRLRKCAIFVIVSSVVSGALVCGAPLFQSSSTLPDEISDAEFWRMITDFSEPGGAYQYENFVSNEIAQQIVIPALKVATKPGGVYIGVGPEQNFTYAVALQAKIAFVLDIRRQNMLELLMYKALFELAPNRADFVARLFSRTRPPGLDDTTTASALFAAYEQAKPDAALFAENLQAIKSTFVKHGFQLTSDDLLKIDYVYQVFYRGGPAIAYDFSSPAPATSIGFPSYTKLMTATDTEGRGWSYLSHEDSFRFIREMHLKNRFVPLVGDFAGSGALRKIATYLTDHKANVTAFYISNVEAYLEGDKLRAFYSNAATLPVDDSSMFIRFVQGVYLSTTSWWTSNLSHQSVVSPMVDLTNAIKAGRFPTYPDVLRPIKDPRELAGLQPNRRTDLGSGPLVYVPSRSPAPAGHTLVGTTRQTVTLVNGTSITVDLDVYTQNK